MGDMSGNWSAALHAERVFSSGLQTAGLLVLLTTGLTTNCLVFLVFHQKPMLRTLSNRYVINLCAVDAMLLGVLGGLLLAGVLHPDTPVAMARPTLCTITGSVVTFLTLTVLLTLTLITLDRFYAIRRPLHYTTQVTGRRSYAFIALTWLVAGVLAVLPTAGWGRVAYHPAQRVCTVDWASPRPADRAYTGTLVAVGFVLPSLVMGVVYTTICRAARRSTLLARRNSLTPDLSLESSQGMLGMPRRRSSIISLTQSILTLGGRRSSASSSRSLLSMYRDDWRTVHTSAIIVVTFALCWLPYFTFVTMEMAGVGRHVPAWLHTAALWLVLLGCAINPFVYVFRCKVIKDEMWDISLFQALPCRRSSPPAHCNGFSTAHAHLTLPHNDSKMTHSTYIENNASNGILKTNRSLSLPEGEHSMIRVLVSDKKHGLSLDEKGGGGQVSAGAVQWPASLRGLDLQPTDVLPPGGPLCCSDARSASIVTFSERVYTINHADPGQGV